MPLIESRFINNPREEEMPRTADVVIIGGGVAGPAAAWALEKASPGIKTVLIEKADQLATGASTASIENFRTCWPTFCIAEMMKRSVDVFLNPEVYFGEGADKILGVKKRGYLYCAFNEKQAESFKKEVEDLKNRVGLPHLQFLNASQVAQEYPWLGNKVVAAKFDPCAGWLDSNSLVHLYAKNAENAKFLFGMTDTRIVVEGDKVTGVVSDGNLISTNKVIIAAGPGSRDVALTACIHLPVVVRPRQSFTTTWRHEDFPEDSPFIISNPVAYVRPESSKGAIFGWAYKLNGTHSKKYNSHIEDFLERPTEPKDKLKDPRFPSLTLATLARSLGHKEGYGFSNSNYLKGLKHQVGYYVSRHPATTFKEENGIKKYYDSERAIIDAWPGIQGLFLSVAHVGHGIMTSPSAGEIVACYTLGKEQELNPVFFDFKLNVAWVENDGGQL